MKTTKIFVCPFLITVFITVLTFSITLWASEPDVLSGTEPLTWIGDCTQRNCETVQAFLDRKTEESIVGRQRYWLRNFENQADYEVSIAKNRQRLRFILGIRDERRFFESPSISQTLGSSNILAETPTHRLYAISWSVFDLFTAEGLLLEPKTEKPIKTIIHIPHADFTPEQILGLDKSTFEPGFETVIENNRIIIPVTVDRQVSKYKRVELTHREYIYRAAYQLGRHIIGYEIQAILGLIDWLKRTAPEEVIRVEGFGDGGMLAFYTGAVDSRVDEVLVAGYFDCRNQLCDEPIDRNVFGLLDQFGDAEIAGLISPRKLIIVNQTAPTLTLSSKTGGAPGILKQPTSDSVRAEFNRAKKLAEPFDNKNWIEFEPESVIKPQNVLLLRNCFREPNKVNFRAEKWLDKTARSQRIIDGMDRHTQFLLEQSELTRKEFWKKLETNSLDAFERSTEFYRNYFGQEIIGLFDDPFVTPKPRTRKYAETSTHTTYEVELDVFEHLTAYGLLLIPKGIKENEKRPVVVCQHGLGGSPFLTLRSEQPSAYQGFSDTLCERGYVVFAPQNLYSSALYDQFRYQQRKLNPLGKTLFSIIVPQHQQILNWLGTLPFVEKEKIAFYGLSYGGKTAMRVPPLVRNYCLSICSGDFNSWNKKVASNQLPFSFIMTNEYEMFEFDLANTFDYSEMATLIAPRPFMVERGHVDSVAWDEYVAFEYAKVLYLYEYLLKIPERTQIHYFNGGHQINGEKTFLFLDQFLK
ncbi:MAG: dienelactone hydrolase family protein [Planctomycetaceae bacterium]|jgi:cephalosporin-C deacetylase-like acetyl esterase|nr:dienelactone hydrolase family protein [Planctomycetaceae bacterium]